MADINIELKDEMLHKLQQIQLMTVELNLYLNTHPDDGRALMLYNQYAIQQTTLRNRYEQLYGPLLNFGYSLGKSPWNYVYEPWPWEI